MAPGPISLRQILGETMKTVTDFIFLGSKITVIGNCSYEIKRLLLFGRKPMRNPEHLKSRNIILVTKVHLVKAMVFPVVHVWMWESYHKEGWVLKNWCFWTVVLKKTLESPLNSKEIKLVNPRGKQPWIFIERTNDEAEAPILWALNAKSWLIRKDPDAGKDWRQKGDDRGWDCWMASLTEWTWVWAGSRRWWRTGRPGVLQPMGSQRTGYDWATEQQNTNQWTMNMKGKKFPDLDLTKLWYFKIFYLKMYFPTLEHEQKKNKDIFDSWYLRKGASENCCIHIYDAK